MFTTYQISKDKNILYHIMLLSVCNKIDSYELLVGI